MRWLDVGVSLWWWYSGTILCFTFCSLPFRFLKRLNLSIWWLSTFCRWIVVTYSFVGLIRARVLVLVMAVLYRMVPGTNKSSNLCHMLYTLEGLLYLLNCNMYDFKILIIIISACLLYYLLLLWRLKTINTLYWKESFYYFISWCILLLDESRSSRTINT